MGWRKKRDVGCLSFLCWSLTALPFSIREGISGLVFRSRDCLQAKQDNYGEVELLLLEVDFKFGVETLRLDSSARIF